jgi:ribosome silencing factor RsfS/YbeB/iojap
MSKVLDSSNLDDIFNIDDSCIKNIPEQLVVEENKTPENFVEDQLKKICGELPYRHEGKQAAQWVLIDYINVVVHVMHPEARNFYKLEEMWSDAPAMEH